MKKIICVYSTRKVDSNLLMAGTIFKGLAMCGYQVDALFCGAEESLKVFEERYSNCFSRISYLKISKRCSIPFRFFGEKFGLLWKYLIEFVFDVIWRPYSVRKIRGVLSKDYDVVLSFLPTYLSGRIGNDVYKMQDKAKLIQFWSDPLSLGGINDISELPARRLLHKINERRVIKWADRVVFVFPLLCEMEKKLHPKFAYKMDWSDIGPINHVRDDYKPQNKKVTVGLFGAYQRKVRNINPFLEAVKMLPKFRFVLRGDSDVLVNPAEYPNLDVKFGRRPVSEVEDLETNCDILLSLNAHHNITPPGKTFYYASFNKPIIYIADGKNSDYTINYFKSLGRFEACHNDVNSITECITRVAAGLRDFKRIIPERLKLDVIARKIIESPNEEKKGK